jgi:hypothetical protein
VCVVVQQDGEDEVVFRVVDRGNATTAHQEAS